MSDANVLQERILELQRALDAQARSESALRKTNEELEANLRVQTREFEESRKALSHMAAIVESSDDAIVSKTLEGIITSWNPAACRIFGYQAEEIIGRSVSLLIPESRINEEPLILERLRRGEKVDHYETVRRRKDGREIHVSVTISPIRAPNGKIIGASKIARDITDRIQTDEKLRQLNAVLESQVGERTAELRNANEELESFSYSVSHDLRAPLRAIDGFSHALLDDYSERLDDQGRDFLRRICRATRRMSDLIDDLLNLSRLTRADLRLQTVDLGGLARDVLADLRHGEPDREVEVIVGDDLMAQGDEDLLRILLVNLLGNAWKFSSKTRNARIEAGRKVENGRVTFFVRDNGAGFNMAYAHKLFGAFERLHKTKEFEGTGIGLAIVRRIVDRHRGEIWAEGDVNHGATFYFTLPV